MYDKAIECPKNHTAWELKESSFNCHKGGKDFRYHCILGHDGNFYQGCMSRVPIPPGTVGCPEVSLTSGSPQLSFPFTQCPLYLDGCPKANHSLYYSNELLLYPLCFEIQEKRNQSSRLTTVNDRLTTTTSSLLSKYEDQSYIPLQIIVPVVSILMAFVLLIVGFILWKKYGAQRERPSIEEELLLNESPSKSYLHIIVIKRMLWTYLKTKYRVRIWKEFFNEEENKHALYKQWKSALCCLCTKLPEAFKKQFISDKGWKTLYQKDEMRKCPLDIKDCSCLYDAKDIVEETISIATLLSIIYSIGKLSKMENRCLSDIRACCENVMCRENTEQLHSLREEIQQLRDVIEDFLLNSKVKFDRDKILDDISMYTERKLDKRLENESIKERIIDTEDLSTLQVDKVKNAENLSAIQERAKHFAEEEIFYVSCPSREKEAMRRLDEDHLLIVTGKAGEGKSSLCRYLFKKDKSAFKLKLQQGQEDFDFMRGTGATFLLYFEDVFGKSQHIKRYSKDNPPFFQEMLEIADWKYKGISEGKKQRIVIKPQYSKFKIICCVRDTVFEEAKSVKKVRDLEKFTFDISSPEWKLKQHDIKRLLQKYKKKYPHIEIQSNEVLNIIEKTKRDDFFGLHECCALCFKSELGTETFYHPQTTLEDEILSIRDYVSRDNYEYQILVYMLLTNKPFSLENIAPAEDLFKKVFRLMYIETENIQRGKYRFIRKRQTTLEFEHQFVREAVLKAFGRKNAQAILEYAADDVIVEYIRPSTYKPVTNEVYICLESRFDRRLARQLLQIHNFVNIAVNKCARDETFVSKHLIAAIKESLMTHCQKLPDKERRSFLNTAMESMKLDAKQQNKLRLKECLDNLHETLGC